MTPTRGDRRRLPVLNGASALDWPRCDRYATVMSAPTTAACPVHAEFDPLSEDFLADPFAVMQALPLAEERVFYAPSIDYYVVSRYADVEAVFLDPETYSAATAQLPLVPLTDEARDVLLEGGHRPQPSMVSLD